MTSSVASHFTDTVALDTCSLNLRSLRRKSMLTDEAGLAKVTVCVYKVADQWCLIYEPGAD